MAWDHPSASYGTTRDLGQRRVAAGRFTLAARPFSGSGCGCQTAFMASGLPFSDSAGNLHAARSYSLISPPSTLRRNRKSVGYWAGGNAPAERPRSRGERQMSDGGLLKKDFLAGHALSEPGNELALAAQRGDAVVPVGAEVGEPGLGVRQQVAGGNEDGSAGLRRWRAACRACG